MSQTQGIQQTVWERDPEILAFLCNWRSYAEVRGGTGQRVRTWDCCACPLFTLQGSGHNPRPTPKERWRQRIIRKFRCAVENFDRLSCVGCGRCSRNCPVSIDLRTVLKKVGA